MSSSSSGRPCASSPRPRSGRTSWSGTRRSAFRRDLLPKLAALGPAGHPVSRGVRRRRRCRPSTTASASRSWRASTRRSRCSVAAHNGLCTSHICDVRHRRPEAAVPAAARPGRSARRLGPDRGRAPAATPPACGRRPTRDGDDWVLNGAKTFITHGSDRRRDGRHGGHRSRPRAIAASRPSSSTAGHAGDVAGQEGEQARHARQRHERSRVRGLPRSGRRSCWASQGRASSTPCRCSTPAASASRRSRSGSRRAPTRPRGATPRSAASSASRLRRSRRSSGSSPTWRRGSRRRRLLTYRAAYLKDQGVARTTRESSMAKLYASEMAVRAADDCVQIHGGYGFVKDYPGREVLPRRQAHDHRRRARARSSGSSSRASCSAVTAARLPTACSRAIRARSRAPSRSSRTKRRGRRRLIRRIFPAHGPRLPRRRDRPARRRQEHAGRSADRRRSAAGARRSASSRSIPPARSRAARSSATASACRRTPATPACSSAAWRRAGTSAGWRARRATWRSCSTPPASDVVLIETVGVGQDEVDIVRTADVSIVTLVPGAGDEVQALKAGIMEIADIFVVNKADREGADRTVASIEAMLSLQQCARRARGGRRSCRTEATTGQGVPELWATIEAFRAHTAAAQGSRRRARAEFRLRELLGAPVPAARRTARARRRGVRRDARSDGGARDRSVFGGGRDHAAGHWATRPDRSSHEVRTRPHRHRGGAPRRERWPGCTRRSASRSKRPTRSRRSACARTSSRQGRAGDAGTARGDHSRVGRRPVRGQARSRPPPRRLQRRRHCRGAGAAEGAGRPPDRRGAAARAPTARSSRSSTRRRPTACSSS